jgi:hypothetical protein
MAVSIEYRLVETIAGIGTFTGYGSTDPRYIPAALKELHTCGRHKEP